MSSQLSRYLKDFSPTIAVPQSDFLPDFDGAMDGDILALPAQEAVDVDAEKRHSYAEGYEAAEQEAQQKHRAELEALADAHRRELQALEEKYRVETVERLGQGLDQLAAALGAAVESAAIRVWSPLLTERLLHKAANELSAMVVAETIHTLPAKVTVKGPEALIEIARTHFTASELTVEYEETGEIDLSFEIEDSVFSTRMGGFLKAIDGGADE